MSDTPRTDAEAGYYDLFDCWKYSTNGECVTSEFARQLERELNAANATVKELEAYAERLEEAGCSLYQECLRFSPRQDPLNEWTKAKETKP